MQKEMLLFFTEIETVALICINCFYKIEISKIKSTVKHLVFDLYEKKNFKQLDVITDFCRCTFNDLWLCYCGYNREKKYKNIRTTYFFRNPHNKAINILLCTVL